MSLFVGGRRESQWEAVYVTDLGYVARSVGSTVKRPNRQSTYTDTVKTMGTHSAGSAGLVLARGQQ